MSELWFAIVVLLFTAWVVLDGFDLGAGALHLWVARTNETRRAVLAAIGPFWDGNEVCLLAAGGALFVAFPDALASGLSGFCLAIFLVIWSLILRGIALEFRGHVNDRLWRAAWDFVFCAASALLPVLLGAALGNVLRGVPLDGNDWFELALFTDFTPRAPVGILDGYTVLVGLFALVALAGHGATFLAWKTEGAVHERARRAAPRLYAAVALLWPLVTWATHSVNPDLLAALPARPLAWFALALAFGGIAAVFVALRRGRDRLAFLGSCGFLAGLLAATAACMHPVLLRALGGGGGSLTVHDARSPEPGLRTALGWFAVGAPLALLWFVILFRLHRGKARAAPEGEGY